MARPRLFAAIVLFSAALLALAACGDGGSGPAATATADGVPDTTAGPPPAATLAPADGGATAEPAFEGGRDPVERTSALPGDAGDIARLVDVRTGRHEGFDRVVFEFTGTLPGYRVEYTTAPAEGCGSGLATEIAGAALLQVRMAPAAAHDDDGASTFGPQELTPGLPAILEIESTCDFEAILTWVVGLSEAADFSVTDLVEPLRVVVDVAHP